MQLNESRRPALFPSRKCYINVRKIDKNTHTPKGTRSGKQLFFPYPSVFAESYVRCVYRLFTLSYLLSSLFSLFAKEAFKNTTTDKKADNLYSQ